MRSKPITLYKTNISEIVNLTKDKATFLKLISKRNFLNRAGSFETISIQDVTENSVVIKHTRGRQTILLNFQKFQDTVTLQISISSLFYFFYLPFLILLRSFFKSNSSDDINGGILIGVIIFSGILGTIFYLIGKYNINNVAVRFEKEYAKINSLSHPTYSEPTKQTTLSIYFIHNGISQEGPYTITELKDKIKKGDFVWKNGMTDWTLAEDVPELKDLFTKMPPPFKTLIKSQNIPPQFKPKKTPPIFNQNS